MDRLKRALTKSKKNASNFEILPRSSRAQKKYDESYKKGSQGFKERQQLIDKYTKKRLIGPYLKEKHPITEEELAQQDYNRMVNKWNEYLEGRKFSVSDKSSSKKSSKKSSGSKKTLVNRVRAPANSKKSVSSNKTIVKKSNKKSNKLITDIIDLY